MKKKVSEIISALEELAPSGTSEKWDNTGLLVGDPDWRTEGAVVSVDLTPQSIQTAIDRGFRLIINHHPCIFPKSRGLSRIVPGPKSGISSLVFEALRNGIAVASYHTNFDQCALEVVDAISKGLGVQPKGRLIEAGEGALLKLVVFVPPSHLERLRGALAQAGAGHIGNYDFCTFTIAGEGTFRGGKETRPFAGKPGNLEKIAEVRVETIFPRGLKKAVLSAMRAAHPYEEVAFDLYHVEQGPASQGLVRGLGYGFWGDYPSPKPFADVARGVKKLFNVDGFLLTDPGASKSASSKRKIKRIGFVAGKGASFIEAASAVGCDLFVTGEAGYHPALDGVRKGLSVIELGHRDSEIFYIQTMKTWISKMGLKTVALDHKTQKIWRNA